MGKTASASGATSLDGCPDVVRVLAVDEDPNCLITLTLMLQRCGYEVTAKASPEEALREVLQNQEAPFDLVMTVARTRGVGIDGFTLLKRLKDRLPVILISDEEPVDTRMRAVQEGASDFLIKPLKEADVCNIWKYVVLWRRLKAANGADPRKRGSAGAGKDSGEGGCHRSQQQQKQCRTTEKTKFNSSPQLHASFVEAAELLKGTEGYCPRGIRDLLAAHGVQVPIEQAASLLEIYEKASLTKDLSATPMAISSHYNNSKNYLRPGSSGSGKRSHRAKNIKQTSLPSDGASPVGLGVHGNESYRGSHVGHVHNNGNAYGYGNQYGYIDSNGEYCNDYGNGDGNGNANYGYGPGGFPSLPSNLAQQVQQAIPTTGLFPSNMMRTMNDPNPVRQQAFPQTSRLSYNGSTGGISMSPWHVDGGDDPLRSYLGADEDRQNTAATGTTQGMHGDVAAGQNSASQPQYLTNFCNWESTSGNGPAGTSGGSGVVTDRMESGDETGKFFN